MKVLHLTIKKKWFDMIVSGEKKEEYREVKEYWISRLADQFCAPYSHEPFNFIYKGFKHGMWSPIAYDAVKFKNGYFKTSPSATFKINSIDIEYGKEEWGAEWGKTYFIIKLGNRVDSFGE